MKILSAAVRVDLKVIQCNESNVLSIIFSALSQIVKLKS